MGIPVKLVLGQWPNESYIDLDATDLAMGVDRRIGYFTLPDNQADRVAIDVNTPSVEITIRGLMRDDDGPITSSNPGSPAYISLYDFYPSSNKGNCRIMEDIIKATPISTITNKVSSTTFDYSGGRLHYYARTGQKLYTTQGVEIGTISSITSTRVVLTAASSVLNGMSLGDKVVRHSPDTFIDGKGLYLFPAYWHENHPGRGSVATQGIALKFDSSLTPTYAGGVDVPVLVSSTFPENNLIPTVRVPVGGLYTGTTAGNPSIGLASIIRDAINANVAVTSTGQVNNMGSNVISGAFTANVDGSTVIVSQDQGDTFFTNPTDMFRQWSSRLGSSGVSEWRFPRVDTGLLGYVDGQVPTHIQFSPPVKKGGVRSAGDKAQDLLGLMANSDGGDDDYISGIQIPYQSLVASSGVDPVVRNFFTTFGDVSALSKSSDSNTIPANNRMETTNVTNLLSTTTLSTMAGEIVDILADFGEGLWNHVFSDSQTFTSNLNLPTGSRGNKGGIHVIPSKINVHYEATENLYYFDLVLSVLDVVYSP